MLTLCSTNSSHLLGAVPAGLHARHTHEGEGLVLVVVAAAGIVSGPGAALGHVVVAWVP